MPGFQATLWVGLMAPSDAAADRRSLNRKITDIVTRPDIKAAWEKQGASPMVMTQAVVHRLHRVGNRQMG